MPIFEYTCGACGREFELILHAGAGAACPSCGSERLDKHLSVFAVGASADRSAAPEPGGPCGTCGDPRGAGSCALD